MLCITRKIIVFSARCQVHIACHCPVVWCFKFGEHGHIVMDCPYRISPSGTPAHHNRPKSCSSCHTRSTAYHHHKDRYRCSRSRSQSHSHRYHSKGHHDSYRGCLMSQHRDNRWHHRSSWWCPHSSTYTHHSHCNTLHCRSSSHKSSSTYSRDCNRSHSWSAYKPTKKISHQSSSQSRRSQGKTTHQKEYKSSNRWPLNGVYSSDDHSSDSEEDLDHLN